MPADATVRRIMAAASELRRKFNRIFRRYRIPGTFVARAAEDITPGSLVAIGEDGFAHICRSSSDVPTGIAIDEAATLSPSDPTLLQALVEKFDTHLRSGTWVAYTAHGRLHITNMDLRGDNPDEHDA